MTTSKADSEEMLEARTTCTDMYKKPSTIRSFDVKGECARRSTNPGVEGLRPGRGGIKRKGGRELSQLKSGVLVARVLHFVVMGVLDAKRQLVGNEGPFHPCQCATRREGCGTRKHRTS